MQLLETVVAKQDFLSHTVRMTTAANSGEQVTTAPVAHQSKVTCANLSLMINVYMMLALKVVILITEMIAALRKEMVAARKAILSHTARKTMGARNGEQVTTVLVAHLSLNVCT